MTLYGKRATRITYFIDPPGGPFTELKLTVMGDVNIGDEAHEVLNALLDHDNMKRGTRYGVLKCEYATVYEFHHPYEVK